SRYSPPPPTSSIIAIEMAIGHHRNPILGKEVVVLCEPRHTRAKQKLFRDRSAAFRRLRSSVPTDTAGLAIDRCCLLAIVPPGLGDAARVARFGRGPAENVPISEPVRGLVPVRHPIAAAAAHTR